MSKRTSELSFNPGGNTDNNSAKKDNPIKDKIEEKKKKLKDNQKNLMNEKRNIRDLETMQRKLVKYAIENPDCGCFPAEAPEAVRDLKKDKGLWNALKDIFTQKGINPMDMNNVVVHLEKISSVLKYMDPKNSEELNKLSREIVSYDAGEMSKGKRIEKEHYKTIDRIKDSIKDNKVTLSNEVIFESIAKEHLDENPKYYSHLEEMEKEWEKTAAKYLDINEKIIEKIKSLPKAPKTVDELMDQLEKKDRKEILQLTQDPVIWKQIEKILK